MTAQSFLPENDRIYKELYKKNVELLVQRSRTDKLLYSVSEAVIAIDNEYKITLFNKAAEKMIGIPLNDSLATDISEIVKIKQKSGLEFDIKNYCFNNKYEEILGLTLVGKYREYSINFKSAVIEHENEDRECIITLADITHEKNLDRTKDEFISVTSHELRTPLAIIKSYLWMVLAGKSGPISDKQKEYLDKAMNATERMISLVNDMLNVAKLEQEKIIYSKDIIDIQSFAKEIVEDMQLKAQEKNIYLNLESDSKRKYIIADSNKLREIFMNFISNAVKFTREGGITVKLEESGEEVMVSVKDTGVGISKEDQQRLFHKFGRLDSSYQTVAESGGTGLGLYIVKMYIEGMGGKIGVESEGRWKGSTFWFILPKAKIGEKGNTTTPAQV